MNIPPALLYAHITIEEINSLTIDERDLLLIICNIWAPIRPPVPTEDNPYPISLNLIRATRRECIIDRIVQAEKVIIDSALPVYIELRKKLSIPGEVKIPEVVPIVVKEEIKEEVNNADVNVEVKSDSISSIPPIESMNVSGSSNLNVSGSN